MKKSIWKKVICFMVALALTVGSIHFGSTKVKAEDLIKEPEGNLVTVDGQDAIQYSFSRDTINNSTTTKAPVNVALLIDASNSMGRWSDRIGSARQVANDFVDGLLNNQSLDAHIYIIYFNMEVKGSTGEEISQNAAALHDFINNTIECAQGTNIADAVYDGVSALAGKEGATLVILSDGEPSIATDNTGKTVGNGNRNDRSQDINTIDAMTQASVKYALENVPTVYAVNFGYSGDVIGSVKTDSQKTLNAITTANDGLEDLQDAFKEITNGIMANATGAKIYAQVGKYVAFDTSDIENVDVIANKKIVSTVLEDGKVEYSLVDSDPENKDSVLVWSIGAPEVDADGKLVEKTNELVSSPAIPFEITADAAELIAAAKDPESGVSVEIVDGKFIITLDVTVTTYLGYTQIEKTTTDNVESSVEKVLSLGVRQFVTYTAYEAPAVSYDVKYVYYDENKKEVEIYSYGDTVLDGTEITITELEEAKFVEKDLNPDDFVYTNLNGEMTVEIGVDSEKSFTIVLEKIEPKKIGYTVKNVFINDDGKEELIGEPIPGEVSEIGEEITIEALKSEEYELVENPGEGYVTPGTYEIKSENEVIKVLYKVVEPEPEPEPEPKKDTWTVKYIVDGKEIKGAEETASVDEGTDYVPEKIKTVEELGFTGKYSVDKTPDKVNKIWTIKYTKQKDTWTIKYFVGEKEIKDAEEQIVVDADTDFVPEKVKSASDLGYTTGEYTVVTTPDKANKVWNVIYTEVISDPEPEPKPDPDPVPKPDPDPVPQPDPEPLPPPMIYDDPVEDPVEEPVVEPVVEPTVVEEPVIEEVEIPVEDETPQSAPEEDEVKEVEIDEYEEEVDIPVTDETPQGAPEEELEDLDDIETPQGLPETGTTNVAVFFGIGAACILLGGVMIVKIRRREDEM